MNEFVADVVKKERSGKYSPIEVAQWLDSAAESAASHLREAGALVPDRNSPEFRRAAIDLRIQIGIGRFFAAKFRAGVLYAAHEQSGNRASLQEALKGERGGSLTPRELQILQQIVAGKSNKEIASDLNLSANTVAVHRANIMDTLGIHKTAELVVYAIRNGLVNLP